jgi:hypothetical protein
VAATIPNDKRTRLVRLLGMLGSDFDGERANAGQMADALVRSLGLRWDDVIAAPHGATRNAAAACLADSYPWTEWELCFLRSIQHRRRLTEKQAAVLRRLCLQAGIVADL